MTDESSAGTDRFFWYSLFGVVAIFTFGAIAAVKFGSDVILVGLFAAILVIVASVASTVVSSNAA